MFRALRTIPVMLGIAGDMAEAVPQAWMLNYTNPMAMNCWAWYAGSPHQLVVGLCHSIQNTSRQVAEYVGVPPNEITFHGAGVNHMSWVLRVEHEGRSLYPALDAAIAADPEGLGRHVRAQVFRRFGYFPTESSEHSAEYVPWFMRDDAEIERLAHPRRRVRAPVARRTSRTVRRREAQAGRGHAAGPDADQRAGLGVHPFSGDRHRARAVRERPQRRTDRRACRNSAASRCPAGWRAGGAVPQPVGALPAQRAALNRTFLNVVELTVRAALDGDRRHVQQAVALDPNAAAVLSLAQWRRWSTRC